MANEMTVNVQDMGKENMFEFSKNKLYSNATIDDKGLETIKIVANKDVRFSSVNFKKGVPKKVGLLIAKNCLYLRPEQYMFNGVFSIYNEKAIEQKNAFDAMVEQKVQEALAKSLPKDKPKAKPVEEKPKEKQTKAKK